ncbi:MAG: helix-turn-helix domain-containing protein [Rickettsiales bacterium]|jgi:transcriptional regulator with XRE-family HTH domain|nr:helix-turn-helix domain-containing protein [Rickettsiales bacterium]
MASILDIKKSLVARVRARRREGKISQSEMAARSGVSLGSIKRFEGSGEISLTSLLRIASVLGYENDFDALFLRKNYQSIQDIINEK